LLLGVNQKALQQALLDTGIVANKLSQRAAVPDIKLAGSHFLATD